MSSYDPRPVTDDEAKQFWCPACKQPRGRPCVYIRDARYVYRADGNLYVNRVKAGELTRRVHTERRWAAVTARRRAQPPVVKPNPELVDAARAMREFDLAEWAKLREWLRANGGILTELGAVLAADARG
jgi:hypothetical protein